MKTIEVSDEVYAAIEDVRANTDPTAADFAALLLLSAWAAASPESFGEQWAQIKKLAPAKPVWKHWAEAVENLFLRFAWNAERTAFETIQREQFRRRWTPESGQLRDQKELTAAITTWYEWKAC